MVLTMIVEFLILTTVFTTPAHAYLDPGSGSMFFQVVAASAVGLLYFLKKYWNNFMSLFHKSANSPKDQNEPKITKRK